MARTVSLESKVFASAGIKVNPDDDTSAGADLLTITGGHIDAQGPYSSHVNFIENRQDALLNLIEKHGILPWSDLTTYEPGALCKVDRTFYQLVEGGDGAQDPSTDDGANWEEFTSGGGGSSFVDVQTEEITLALDQTEVSLTNASTSNMELYIEGAREFDFTVTGQKTFELPESFPTGTRIWVVSAEVYADAENIIVESTAGSSRTLKGWVDGQVYSYATLADVFAETELKVGTYVQTEGYNAALDYGANRYLCVPVGTEVADGGRFIDHPNSPVQLKGIFPTGVIRPEQYGAHGGGVEDDTDAFRRMLSCPIRTFAPNPAGYRISGQLDFGRESTFVSLLNLTVTTGRDAPGADLGIQTGGGDQHLGLLFLQGKHNLSGVRVRTTTTATPWLSIISNDFYLHGDGTRPSYPTEYHLGGVDIEADSWVDGYSGDGNGCLRVQAADTLDIGSFRVANYAVGSKVSDIGHLRLADASITNARQGFQATYVLYAECGPVDFQGTLDNLAYQPGANSLVIRGVRFWRGAGVVCRDTGEHGVRVTSSFAVDGAVGIPGEDNFSFVSLGEVSIYRPGACGFKADSGTASEEPPRPISGVMLSSLYVEDAGRSDYDTGGTFSLDNHFGLSCSYVGLVSIGSYITKRGSSLYNGKRFIQIRACSNVNIPTVIGEGCYQNAMFLSCGGEDSGEQQNFNMPSCQFTKYGLGGSGYALQIFNLAYLKNVVIDIVADNAPSWVTSSGDQGSPDGPWYIRGRLHDINDTEVPRSLPTANINVVTERSTMPTGSGETYFSTGTTLLCRGEGSNLSPLRNNPVDVYLDSTNSRGFIAVKSGEDASAMNPGSQMVGVWRSLGQVSSDFTVLVQRVR